MGAFVNPDTMTYYTGTCPNCDITVECICDDQTRLPGSGSCANDGQRFTPHDQPECSDFTRNENQCENNSCLWNGRACISQGPPGCERAYQGKLKNPRNKVNLPRQDSCAACRQACLESGNTSGYKWKN